MGGVDSPVRSFRAVGGVPVFFARGRGAYLWDVDGRRYVDLVSSWGANLLGNAPERVVRAVRTTVRRGLTYGAPSPLEHELAEKILRCLPGAERLRFVNSGTEATMSAVRVARGFTGRPKVVKFEGGYHGHSDGLLARAGSGAATQALPDSAGVPPSIVADTLLAPYNDADAVGRLFGAYPTEIAAVLVEPVAGNMGVVPPAAGFLPTVGRLCRENGALLIADEVITGFRLRRGAVYPEFGLHPDIVTLGKVIGGGLPVGAFAGRHEVMDRVAPLGPVYQAGTLSGSPVVMAAGVATLNALTPAVYQRLNRASERLAEAWRRSATDEGVDRFHLTQVGSMFGLFFGAGPPQNFHDALQVDREAYARFFHAMLVRGVYLPPSPLESTFVSTAIHSLEISRVARAARAAFRAARRER